MKAGGRHQEGESESRHQEGESERRHQEGESERRHQEGESERRHQEGESESRREGQAMWCGRTSEVSIAPSPAEISSNASTATSRS